MSRRPITAAEIAASTTPSGGYSAKQFRRWGIGYPPKRGWQKRLVLTGVSADCPYPAGFIPPAEVVPTNSALAFGPRPKVLEMPADALQIFTDGSCDPNPGPGGWAFAVYRGDAEIHSACGGEVASTNNRMELQAIIQALRWLNPKQAAVIWTDSQYAQRGCTAWRHGWKRQNWTRGNTALANADLWRELDGLLDTRIVDVRWVRGHAGTIGNERADELAEEGRRSVLGSAVVRTALRPGSKRASRSARAGDVHLAQSGRASEATLVGSSPSILAAPVVTDGGAE